MLWVVPGAYFVFVGAEFAAMTHLALVATAAGKPPTRTWEALARALLGIAPTVCWRRMRS